MPCPEENPCSEVRQYQIALQNADQTLLLAALRRGGWKANLRTNNVGIFFTGPGITGWWEPGRDMRLEGPRVERAKILSLMLHDYALETIEATYRSVSWMLVNYTTTDTLTHWTVGPPDAPLCDFIHFTIQGENVHCTCDPMRPESMEIATTFLAQLDQMFGAPVAFHSETYDAYAGYAIHAFE